MLSNVRSLWNKKDELELVMAEHCPDVLALTETWLTEDIRDCELTVPGYDMRRTDRLNERHGGVMLYIGCSWTILQTSHHRGPDQLWEVLCCHLRNSQGKSLDVAVLYRSPRSEDVSWIQILGRVAQKPNIVILGDFNLPEID